MLKCGMHRPLDPRICNVIFDANAFNRDGGPGDADVDRILELGRAGKINLIAPWSVREEIGDPRTPATVRTAGMLQIFTYRVGQTAAEIDLFQRVRAILRGNAAAGKHDADARHVVEAAKYGGYFITHDRRINHSKREAVQAALPPSLTIVTLSDFLAIYDKYEAGDF